MVTCIVTLLYVIDTETPAEIIDITGIMNMSSTISTSSFVPALPSLIKKQDNAQDAEQEDYYQSVDPLTLEVEMHDLIDKVTILEEGHKLILKVQSSILKNQEENLIFFPLLLSRSVNKGIRYLLSECLPLGTIKTKHLFDDNGAAEDFFNSLDKNSYMLSPTCIPPPPVQHLPLPPHQPYHPAVPPRDPHLLASAVHSQDSLSTAVPPRDPHPPPPPAPAVCSQDPLDPGVPTRAPSPPPAICSQDLLAVVVDVKEV